MAYEKLEGPVGEVRSDYRMATLAAIIANTVRNEKKRKKPYTSKDFMPRWEQPSDDQVMHKGMNIFKMLAEKAKAAVKGGSE